MCLSHAQKNQNTAQQGQLNLANTEAGIAQQNQAQTNPFYTTTLRNGLPFASSMNDFSGGNLARSYAQARGALNRQITSTGANNLPSGYATTATNQLNAQQARDYDSSQTGNQMLNFQAKTGAASALNPMPFFQGAQSGYGNVTGTPAQGNPWLGMAGGIASGLLNFI